MPYVLPVMSPLIEYGAWETRNSIAPMLSAAIDSE